MSKVGAVTLCFNYVPTPDLNPLDPLLVHPTKFGSILENSYEKDVKSKMADWEADTITLLSNEFRLNLTVNSKEHF